MTPFGDDGNSRQNPLMIAVEPVEGVVLIDQDEEGRREDEQVKVIALVLEVPVPSHEPLEYLGYNKHRQVRDEHPKQGPMTEYQ